jgi:signal transduction histidine kinase
MQNINQMLSQLEADQQMRTTFVSTLTHDLRTPLFAQRRVLEGIEKVKARYDEDLCFMLETAHKANDQVLEMVNKLLEAYQYEAGHIQIRSEAVSLFKLIDESFRALHPLAQAKQIRLENLVSPELTLKADPKQLQRVFQNLVSNAIANIQSEKTISVRAEADETEMIIRVQDNGPGIPTELLPHLFQRYFTGDSRQQIGSGLGLFICRMIVELHGGTITVESNPGIGTTFQITLLKAPPQPGD